ncbi:MAG TPA: alpha/beta hydrolase [Sedimentisphaerales bacterium]|nr:alpha/beta hydrolase [Sedimentisphaerales bacterium]HNU29660.1 alpha/beta hydrolase [Sedimentisphaerales bacterium]
MDCLGKYIVGGVGQWVHFAGRDLSNPVLVFLHGGPGLPLFPMRRMLKQHTGLEDLFTVVYWEQRGTGKSLCRNIPPESMTIEQFVSDVVDVAELARGQFGVERVFLLGHSWGSIIGVLAACRRPDLFHAYIGVGQVVHMLEGDLCSYYWARRRAQEQRSDRAQQDLEKIGPPPYSVKALIKERAWVQKFGGLRRDEGFSVAKTFIDCIRTPQYTLLDVLRMARHQFFSLEHLLGQMYDVDLFKQAPRLHVPVFFLEGRHDFAAPSELAESYHAGLEAQAKRLIWFENSAHYPFFEEPQRFREILRNDITSIAVRTT